MADGANWKPVPDNKLCVIDLTSDPPKLVDTLSIGKQPSGLSINRAGNLALVANRADNSISVLSIQGKTVKLIDTVAIGADHSAGRAASAFRRLAIARIERPDVLRAAPAKRGERPEDAKARSEPRDST